MRFTFKDLPPEDSEKYLDIIIYRDNRGPKPVAKIWHGKQSRPYYYYSFKNEEHREKCITEEKIKAGKIWEYKQQQKAEKKLASQNLVNPFQIGDIIYNSWGWEQTNIDFYQVVALGPKSIKLRSITSKAVPESEYPHGMACMVVPVKDKFLETSTHEGRYKKGNPPFTKTLKGYIDRDGSCKVTIRFKHGYGGKWEGQPLYNSWYA